MGRRKLIINADDYGVCKETNKAITGLILNNKITSTSLIATASASDEAIELAKKHNIKVGVHLALNSDYPHHPWQPAAPADKVRSLTDDTGYLNYDLNKFKKKAKSKEVSLECDSQYDYIVSRGVTVDHADNHCGTLYGINGRLFFYNAFKFCRDKALPFRFPKRNTFLKASFPDGLPRYIIWAHKFVLSRALKYTVRLIDDMITNPYPIDEIDGYKGLSAYYLEKIRNIGEGVTELFLHPSYDAPVYNQDKEWLKRVYELEFLNSKELEQLLIEEGIEKVDYSAVL
ncbi:MAG: ChbG/HpnK family deacetylase [Christensenellales bacterium]|jgi:predicted glycoside hydrolase/deacetylase ChbG (UPF0249 family)